MRKVFLLFCFSLFVLTSYSQTPSRFEEKPKEEENVNTEKSQKEKPSTNKPINRRTQKSQKSFFEKLSFGGNLGLQFGTYTAIDIQPRIYYAVTEKLSVGIGGTYSYYKYSNSTPNPYFRGYSNNVYGFNALTFFQPLDDMPIILQAEYESLNWGAAYVNQNTNEIYTERIWSNNLFLGGGIMSKFGEKSAAFFLILYNVTYNPNTSYYSQPYVIRVGFAF